jgi:chemotaxis family two-component system response regulator Rcp1
MQHLLHVDDDEDDRLIFSQAYARSGLKAELHSIARTSDALLFINRLGPYKDAPRPRLIVLDLSLPRMDGREFLQILKGNSRFKGIAIVILTGSESYVDIVQCRKLGVTDYLVKPQTQEELAALIATFDHWLVGSSSGIAT